MKTIIYDNHKVQFLKSTTLENKETCRKNTITSCVVRMVECLSKLNPINVRM